MIHQPIYFFRWVDDCLVIRTKKEVETVNLDDDDDDQPEIEEKSDFETNIPMPVVCGKSFTPCQDCGREMGGLSNAKTSGNSLCV